MKLEGRAGLDKRGFQVREREGEKEGEILDGREVPL